MHFTEAERILGVGPLYLVVDVKKAFRRKSLETHPDRGGTSDKDFSLVFRAKELLLRRLRGEFVDDDDPQAEEQARERAREQAREKAQAQAQAQVRPPTVDRRPSTMGWTRPPPFRGAPTEVHSTDAGRRTGFQDRDAPWSDADNATRLGTLVGYPVKLLELLFDGRPYPHIGRVVAEVGVCNVGPFGLCVVIVLPSPIRSVRTASGIFFFDGDPDLVRFGGRAVCADRDVDGLPRKIFVEA